MNDEYLSREALLKHLDECRTNPLFDPEMARMCFAISVFIEDMQATDVQPVKHGRWKSSANTIESGTVKCSNCRSEMYIDDLLAVSASNDNLPNYCPNCGARMDGGDKDDN